MQVVLDNGTVLRDIRDLLDALTAFNVPASIIEMVEGMCDREAALERVRLERLNSDLASYEASLEAYEDALSEILEIVGADKTKKTLEIKRLIENVL